jgi:hypothetical protein
VNISLEDVLATVGLGFGTIVALLLVSTCFFVWIFVKGYRLATSAQSNPMQQKVGVGLMLAIGIVFLVSVLSNEGHGYHDKRRGVTSDSVATTGSVFRGRSCVTIQGVENCVESTDAEEFAQFNSMNSAQERIKERQRRIQEALDALN